MPKDPTELFAPLSWYPLGNGEAVRTAQPKFPKWTGPSPGSDFGGKPICDFEGRPSFGELSVLWTCQAAGWAGAWVRPVGNKATYCIGFWGPQEAAGVPSDVQLFLDGVAAQRGGTVGGTWDVLLWDPASERVIPDSLRFIEAKYGADKIKPAQVDWYDKMRASGVPKSSFLIVEWSQVIPQRTSI